jgi:beta-lactamase regulating signal transducer with metallopeptidase domain
MKEVAEQFVLLQLFSPHLTLAVKWLVKSSALLALAWTMTLFLKNRSARARCWVWRLMFVGLATLLLIQFSPRLPLRPRITIPIPEESRQTFWRTAESAHLIRSYEDQKALVVQRRAKQIDTQRISPPWEQNSTIETEPSPFDARGAVWAWIEAGIPKIWLFGSALALLFITFRTFSSLCWLRIRSNPADDSILEEVSTASLRLGTFRKPQIRITDGLTTPLLFGVSRPLIYLPRAVHDWHRQRIVDVLCHELSHWKRKDFAWLQFARVVLAFFWWNPLLRIALRGMSQEAEEATDDMVILGRESPESYARTLIEIATEVPENTRQVGLPMVGYRVMEKRIQSLMRDNYWRGKVGKLAGTILATTVLFTGIISTIAISGANPAAAQASKEEALTEKQRTLIKRIIANQQKRTEALRYTHVRMTSLITLETPDGQILIKPEPSKIELWWDQWANIYRAEYRPGVDRWIDGSRPFHIANRTEISNGKKTYYFHEPRRPGTEIPWADARGPEDDYLGASGSTSLIKNLTVVLNVNSLKTSFLVFNLEETRWQGKDAIEFKVSLIENGRTYQQETFIVVPDQNDLLRFTEFTPSDGKARSQEIFDEVAKTPSGEYYATRFTKSNRIVDDKKLTAVYTISSLKPLTSLPVAITDFPEPDSKTGSH